MDISPNNVAGECELKCHYYFQYSKSNCIVSNQHTSLEFKYDTSVTPPVYYNEYRYSVGKVQLFAPSIHLFNGTPVNAELVITHYPLSTGNTLLVCVPIVVFPSFSSSTSLLDSMIASCATAVPTENMTANLPITNFNLQSLVPKSPFYSYSDHHDGVQREWIVFGKPSAIPISQTSLTTLNKIVKPLSNASTVFPGGASLFYNKKGPATTSSASDGAGNNEIYIDCQPTDASEEEVVVPNSSNPIQYDLGSQSGFTTFLQISLVSIIIFAMLFGFYYAFSHIHTKYGTTRVATQAAPKPSFTLSHSEGMTTAIYLIAYVMWAALLAGMYFVMMQPK